MDFASFLTLWIYFMCCSAHTSSSKDLLTPLPLAPFSSCPRVHLSSLITRHVSQPLLLTYRQTLILFFFASSCAFSPSIFIYLMYLDIAYFHSCSAIHLSFQTHSFSFYNYFFWQPGTSFYISVLTLLFGHPRPLFAA